MARHRRPMVRCPPAGRRRPGRPSTGNAVCGPAPSGLPERAAELVADLKRRGVEKFALFGHEGAALLGYQVAVELDRRGAPAPLRLFISGCPAPQYLSRYAGEAHTEPTDDELTERVLATAVAMGTIPLPSIVAAGARAPGRTGRVAGLSSAPPGAAALSADRDSVAGPGHRGGGGGRLVGVRGHRSGAVARVRIELCDRAGRSVAGHR